MNTIGTPSQTTSTLYVVSEECALLAPHLERVGWAVKSVMLADMQASFANDVRKSFEYVVIVTTVDYEHRWKQAVALFRNSGLDVYGAIIAPPHSWADPDPPVVAALIDEAAQPWEAPASNGPAWKQGLSPITAQELLTKTFAPSENLIAPWLPIKGLGMIYGPRGIGKTHVALGIACAVAAGGCFLNWAAPKPRRVIIIDGEMPASVLQERLAQIVASGNFDVPPENLRICAADLEPDGLPDLASPEAQRYFDRAIADADLILIDNLSTLAPGVRENEADSWVPVQAWALRQRRQGRSVLFVHHAGKGGNQRGTSRKEDVLNTVIALRQPPDYSPSQGARFEVHYEKARGFFGADAQPFEAVLRDGQWTIADIRRGGDDETISTLRQQGLSVREIAERTGVPKSSVDRRLRRLDA